MDVFEKIKLTSANSLYETAEDVQHLQPTPLDSLSDCFPVMHAHLPNGKTVPLLKTMQTSVCERNCNYCCFRAGRDTPRANLTPDELASAVVKLTQAKIAKGIFLSSGVAGGGVKTQDKLIATAEILRSKYKYREYIHLKIMPGAEKDQIFKSMQLADRVSINLEAPNEFRLNQLAPKKIFFKELLKTLELIEEIRATFPSFLGWNHTWASSTTQFVVGAVGETDLDLLQATEQLQKIMKISRAYYSRFIPVKDTPFEDRSPCNPWRQHRLYQAYFLIKSYQFDLEELPFNKTGNLSLEKDPKLLWAEGHLLHSPVDINTADYSCLLKIPGVGPTYAKQIINTRKHGKIRDVKTLSKIGVSVSRASKFILLDGFRPPFQPGLFDHANPKQGSRFYF